MRGDLFDTTLPFGEPQLQKASAYRRYLDGPDAEPNERQPQLSKAATTHIKSGSKIASRSPQLGNAIGARMMTVIWSRAMV